MKLTRLPILFCLFALWTPAQADDWAQWRGPKRDGQAPAAPVWPAGLGGLQQKWRVELDASYSGPLVVGDTVITTASKDKTFEFAIALDRATGKEKWKVQWEGHQGVPFYAASNGDWIRSTPACDGTTVYIAGMRDVLVALNLETGKEKWRVDFVKDLAAKPPAFGFVCSPLLDGDFIYVQAGGAFCKLAKSTGKLVWKSLEDGGGTNGSAFASPIITELGGTRQLVVQTRKSLCGVNIDTGAELWSQPISAFQGMNILTPVVKSNRLFTSAYGGKTQAFSFDKKDGAHPLSLQWEHKTEAYMSSPVVIAGKVFLHLRNQRITCFDLATGQQHWLTDEKFGKYMSMVAQGDRILALDERGLLLLIKANPEKFELIEQKKISDQDTWAHLAISGKALYIRELKALSCWTW
jgi:outer membrane protein assembly factor BamB